AGDARAAGRLRRRARVGTRLNPGRGRLASPCRRDAGAPRAASALAHPLPAALRWGDNTVRPSRSPEAPPCGHAGRAAVLPSERAGSSPKEAIMSTSRRDFLATSLAGLVSAAFAHPGLARVLLRPGQE